MNGIAPRCHPERQRGPGGVGGMRDTFAPPLPPGPSLTLGVTNARSQFIRSRADGEGSLRVDADRKNQGIPRFARDDKPMSVRITTA